METAEKKPVENAMDKREVRKVVPWKRVCEECGNRTLDEHETICLACGAITKIYEGK